MSFKAPRGTADILPEEQDTGDTWRERRTRSAGSTDTSASTRPPLKRRHYSPAVWARQPILSTRRCTFSGPGWQHHIPAPGRDGAGVPGLPGTRHGQPDAASESCSILPPSSGTKGRRRGGYRQHHQFGYEAIGEAPRPWMPR